MEILSSGPLLLTKTQLMQRGLRRVFAKAEVRRALRRLKQRHWIQRYGIQTCCRHRVDCPVLIWQPDQPCPDFHKLKKKEKLEDQRRSFWKTIHVYVPSRQTVNLFGMPHYGVGTIENQTERLEISDVFSAMMKHTPSAQQRWIWNLSEQNHSEKRFQGFCLTSTDGSHRGVGVIAAQSCNSLKRLHAHCSLNEWPLELW